MRSCCGRHEGADTGFERAVETLRELGAEIVVDVDLSGIAAVREHEVRVMRVELKAGIRLLGLCSSPAAVAGYPHGTVPPSFVHGLPVGLSLVAGRYQEGKRLANALAFEQATDAGLPPTFPERVA